MREWKRAKLSGSGDDEAVLRSERVFNFSLDGTTGRVEAESDPHVSYDAVVAISERDRQLRLRFTQEERRQREGAVPTQEQKTPSVNPYAASCAELLQFHKLSEQDNKRANGLRTMAQAIEHRPVNATAGLSGHRRFENVFARINRIAADMGMTLEPIQRNFVEKFMMTCAPLIYGPDWASSKYEFFRRYKVDDEEKGVCVMTPRQFGKTTTLAIFATALLLEVRKIQVAIISTGKDSAKRLLDLAKGALHKHGDGADRQITDSTEHLSLVSPQFHARYPHANLALKKSDPDKSTIHSFCSTINSKYTRTHTGVAIK